MFRNLFGLLAVLWGSTLWERMILMIIGFVLAVHYGIIVATFDALLYGIFAIAVLVIIRIIAKGAYLNGDAE